MQYKWVIEVQAKRPVQISDFFLVQSKFHIRRQSCAEAPTASTVVNLKLGERNTFSQGAKLCSMCYSLLKVVNSLDADADSAL